MDDIDNMESGKASNAGLQSFGRHDGTLLALQNAVQEGIASGIAKDFNAKKFLGILKDRKNRPQIKGTL